MKINTAVDILHNGKVINGGIIIRIDQERQQAWIQTWNSGGNAIPVRISDLRIARN
jgi:hypothetical protein